MTTTYIVQLGDTLSKIAQRKFGDAERYDVLFNINHATITSDWRNSKCIKDYGGVPADWIFPGQVLRLP